MVSLRGFFHCTFTCGLINGALALALLVHSSPPEAAPVDLGPLEEPGGAMATNVTAVAINNAGQIAGYATNAADRRRPFLWQNGYMRGLGDPSSSGTAVALNGNGDVIGDLEPRGGETTHAFVWRQGMVTDLNDLRGDGCQSCSSNAIGINDEGQIIGVLLGPSGRRGFLYDGVMVDLGSLGGAETMPNAINNTGQVVGWSQTQTGLRRAFIWQDGAISPLAQLGGGQSEAVAINDAGQVIGASSGQTVIWEPALGTVRQLFDPASFCSGCSVSFPIAINAKGQVIGYATARLKRYPFLWDPVSGVKMLKTPQPLVDGDIQTVSGINDAGRIVGCYVTPAGESKLFLWEAGAIVDLGPCQREAAINASDQIAGTLFGPVARAYLSASFLQCRADDNGYWSDQQYAFHSGATMCQFGCATTALSMALSSAGISSVPRQNSSTFPEDESVIGMTALDPGHLNSYMTSEATSLDYNYENNVDFAFTTKDLSAQLARRQTSGLSGGIKKPLKFQFPTHGVVQSAFIDDALEQGLPVIVKVNSLIHPDGPHFVLVISKLEGEYQIADPAGCSVDTRNKLPPGYTCQLGGGLTSLLSAYGGIAGVARVAGYVKDPPGDLSLLGISASDGVEVVLIAPDGKKTGIDPSTGSVVEDIPGSTSFVDQLADEKNPDGPTLGSSQTIYVEAPEEGAYQLMVKNHAGGPVNVTVRVYSQDGQAQRPTVLQDSMPAGTNRSYSVQVRTGTLGMDTSPPGTTSSITPPPNGNGWNNTPIAVHLAASDEGGGSGVKQITYSLAGAQTGSAVLSGNTASIAIARDGVTTLTYFAVDNAGNQEPAKTLTIRIDTVPPVLLTNPNPPANTNGWNNSDVTVQFNATDALSGVAGTTPVLVTTEGRGIVVGGSANDLAGNTATASITLNIDKTPPTISGLPGPGCSLWPPNHKLVEVANVTVSDALSGIAPSSLQITAISNEAADGTDPDIVITGTSVKLRAERSGNGRGRVYTIKATVQDAAGNSASSEGICIVPHDHRK